MKVYCQHCGAKIEFSVRSKPKFCHSCGTSLSLGSDQVAHNKKSSNTKNTETDDYDDEVQEVPSISELDVEIEVHEIGSQSIETLMGTSKGSAAEPKSNKTPWSKEEFREQFQKEAGSLRPSGNPRTTDEKE